MDTTGVEKCLWIGFVVGQDTQGHSVGSQEVDLGHSDLDRIEAKEVGDELVVFLLFPLQDVLSLRRIEPVVKAENRHDARGSEIERQENRSRCNEE